jgi:hypothetical protein
MVLIILLFGINDDMQVLSLSVAVDRFNNYMLERKRKEMLAVVNGSPVLALRLKLKTNFKI